MVSYPLLSSLSLQLFWEKAIEIASHRTRTKMEDAEVPCLAFFSWANINRVEQLRREARGPRKRETTQYSCRRTSSMPLPTHCSKDPSSREQFSLCFSLQGLLKKGEPVCSFVLKYVLKNMKELSQKYAEHPLAFSSLSHFCSFLQILDKRQWWWVSAFAGTSWRVVEITAASLCPTFSQPQLKGRPSLSFFSLLPPDRDHK